MLGWLGQLMVGEELEPSEGILWMREENQAITADGGHHQSKTLLFSPL
jgi:hypothetical protein